MAKKDENDPITEDEYLLRRVYRDKFRTRRVPRISPRAFEPRVEGRDPDTSGISLYREDCQDVVTDILAFMEKSKQSLNGIVRIQVKMLKELGLSVVSDKDTTFGISGHVLVPELNSGDYAEKKAELMSTLLALAEEASKDANVLVEPSQ